MEVYPISTARKILGELINRVKFQKQVIALGNRGRAEVLLVSFSSCTEEKMPMTAMNADSRSFHFLAEEPELYSQDDLKKRYV